MVMVYAMYLMMPAQLTAEAQAKQQAQYAQEETRTGDAAAALDGEEQGSSLEGE